MPRTAQVDGGAGDAIARPTGAPQPAVEDNSHAGQGSVMLDIGGEIGALVIDATAELEGVEIEIRPTGATPFADGHPAAHHDETYHGHDHDHARASGQDEGHHPDHEHPDHEHDHSGHRHGGHTHEPPGQLDGHRLVHVAVLKRPSAAGDRYAAVFPELHAGTYELYRRPAEPVALTVSVTGARVTAARWPEGC